MTGSKDANRRTRQRVIAPLRGELRYGLELARLLADERFRGVTRAHGRRPVLLIPGFLAGDTSLAVLGGWLRRRGHEVRGSGMWINADCAGRELARLERRLAEFDAPVIVIGQSRGGTLARALAARHPQAVAALVTLGSPVRDPLAVSAPVRRTVGSLARLGDLGLPGMFSTDCRDGACCTEFRALLEVPLPPSMPTLAVHSRSDGIVDWRACLDPYAECIEVDGSHCGMAVNAGVYRELERLFDRTEEAACKR
ncbi:MAG: esterase/lipase family protein [Solirubrobacterales bacterium]